MNTAVSEADLKELEQVSGGFYDELNRCPRCQGKDLLATGPADIGTPPCFHCKSCGYEWMMALSVFF